MGIKNVSITQSSLIYGPPGVKLLVSVSVWAHAEYEACDDYHFGVHWWQCNNTIIYDCLDINNWSLLVGIILYTYRDNNLSRGRIESRPSRDITRPVMIPGGLAESSKGCELKLRTVYLRRTWLSVSDHFLKTLVEIFKWSDFQGSSNSDYEIIWFSGLTMW